MIKKIAPLLTAVLLLGGLATAAPAQASQPTKGLAGTTSTIDAQSTSSVEDSADWEAIFPDGSRYLSTTGYVPKPGTIEPRLLNFFDWASCKNPNDPNHVITSWGSKYHGNIALECGSATSSGYNHIKSRHEKEWADLIKRFGGESSWDDFMAYVSKSSLSSPSAIYGAGFGKTCYTTPVNMINHKNGDKVTLKPTVVISTNNKRVITSYPGGGCR